MAMPIFSSSTLLQMSATAAVTSVSAAHILNLNHSIVSLNANRKSISASSSSFISRYSFNCDVSRTFQRRISYPIRPLSPVMEWQDCTVKREVDVPISVAYKCYSDREAIPEWMPFISTVKILEDKPDLSRWSLKYKAFGQNIEYSWLARNMQPTPNQKIHWRSLEGLPNRGAVRFFPKGSSSCLIELTVSYEVPQLLVPVASALKPLLENLLERGLERFARFAKSYSADTPK
ncbi:uncharacterized protein LOC132063303 [Lycium ferocissimum]|uniref:uncharacterized protein LOC132063303 n=1 Tax=Lycium ferocissimum TaxID=112874 RepID=UPI002814CD46|nr:uncharacterized protein LOC132063303 [Lycium ferocissimum]